MYSKKYILICGIANIISGAPIYFKHNMIISRKYEEYITAVDCDVPYFNTIK